MLEMFETEFMQRAWLGRFDRGSDLPVDRQFFSAAAAVDDR